MLVEWMSEGMMTSPLPTSNISLLIYYSQYKLVYASSKETYKTQISQCFHLIVTNKYLGDESGL